MIDEHRFRALCRKEFGGLEGERFQKALDNPANKGLDILPVIFDVGIDDTKIVEIPRDDVEFYARLAKEERQPETELLKYIKPDVHSFVKLNRLKIVAKLMDAMLESPSNDRPITVTWPLWTPDVIPVSVAQTYVKRYS